LNELRCLSWHVRSVYKNLYISKYQVLTFDRYVLGVICKESPGCASWRGVGITGCEGQVSVLDRIR
jgi:hypothetical protein